LLFLFFSGSDVSGDDICMAGFLGVFAALYIDYACSGFSVGSDVMTFRSFRDIRG
jgi:hypothetical protein